MAAFRASITGIVSHIASCTALPARAAPLVKRVSWQPRLIASIRPLHSSASLSVDQTAQPAGPFLALSPPLPILPIDWRHDLFGFSAERLPHIIRISLPSRADDWDVRKLLKKHKISVKSLWIQKRSSNLRRHLGYCYLEIPDDFHKKRLLAALPRWRLAGEELAIQTEWLKDLATKNIVSSMSKGWYANHSSDISACRYRRPHDRFPGYLREARLQGRIIRVGNLPPCSAFAGFRKRIMQGLYKRLHGYDVEGVDFHTRRTLKLPSGTYSGDHVYIMFSKAEDAQAACHILHGNLIAGRKPMTMVLKKHHIIPNLRL